MKADRLFLEELRLQYEKEFELKSNLESKANNIITASGTVAGFLLIFGTFLLGGLNQKSGFGDGAMVSLAAGIAIAVTAILFSIYSSILKKYSFVLGDVSALTIEDKNNKKNRKPNEVQIKHFTDKDECAFTEEMIIAYAKSIYDNASENDKKAKAVMRGQWAFFGSVIFAFVLIVILILAFNFNEFSFVHLSSL